MLRVLQVLVAVGLLASCERSSPSSRAREQSKTPDVTAPASAALRDGDLIFQESTSAQSEMVAALTDSRWTHMGVIFLEPTGAVVFEAASPVRQTPLRRWIAHGREGRYVVKRLRDAEARLPPATIQRMKKLSATWRGRPYDARFRWSDDALYCSELAFKLFDRAANVRIGELQRAADMNLDTPAVRRAIAKRYAGQKLDPEETVITPDAMFHDDQLVTVEP